MKRHINDVSEMVRNRSHSFADGFVSGLASLIVLHEPRRSRLNSVDPMTALRGDMQRIGDDMRRVMDRERGREEANSQARRRAK